MMPRIAGLIALLAAALAVQAQPVYRWVDKQGKVHYSDQPPPADAKQVRQPRLNINTVETSDLPYETQKAMQDFPVRLFTSPECQSECIMARDFLKRRGIPYGETSVKTQEDVDSFTKTFKSALFVPSLAVGGRIQKGYEESAWNGTLDAAGYPRSVPPRTKTPVSAPAELAPEKPAGNGQGAK